jgi:hypothetical protein
MATRQTNDRKQSMVKLILLFWHFMLPLPAAPSRADVMLRFASCLCRLAQSPKQIQKN